MNAMATDKAGDLETRRGALATIYGSAAFSSEIADIFDLDATVIDRAICALAEAADFPSGHPIDAHAAAMDTARMIMAIASVASGCAAVIDDADRLFGATFRCEYGSTVADGSEGIRPENDFFGTRLI